MTLNEGFAVLGVDASADPDAVRRAYLRLVKQHKPDRDPEGFRRVREAYELVSNRARLIVPDERLEAAGLEAQEQAASVPNAQEAEDIRLPAENVVLAPYLASVAELPEIARTWAIVAVWKQAVAAHPDSAAARFHLYEAYQALGWRKDAADVAVAAYQDGMRSFASLILARHPERAQPELIEYAAAQPELWNLLALAHIERRELARAAELTLRLIQDQRCDENGPLSPDTVLRVIALLGSGERPDLASKLVAALQKLLDQDASAARMLSENLAVRWAILREGDRLRERLPIPVYEAIFTTTVPTQIDAGLEIISLWAAQHGLQALRVVKLLAKESPVLHDAFAAPLAPAERRRASRMQWSVVGMAAVVLLLFARQCVPGDHSARAPGYSPRPVTHETSTPARQQGGRGPSNQEHQ